MFGWLIKRKANKPNGVLEKSDEYFDQLGEIIRETRILRGVFADIQKRVEIIDAELNGKS